MSEAAPNGPKKPQEFIADQPIELDTGFEELDSRLDALEKYIRRATRDSSILDEYDHTIGNDPRSFFRNYQWLKELPQEKRLFYFFTVCRELEVSVADAENYLLLFPGDTRVAAAYIGDVDEAATSGRKWNVISLTYDYFNRNGFYMGENDQIARIHERRRYAPEFVMSEPPGENGHDIERFGEAALPIIKIDKEACKIADRGDRLLDTRSMYGSAFDRLDSEHRKQLLMTVLRNCHRHLLFNETFNSYFRPENTHRDRDRSSQMDDSTFALGLRKILATRPEAAHSMIYGTKQPLSAYNIEQSYFQNEMDSTPAIGGAIEEYPFHKMLIKTLDTLAAQDVDDETVGVVIEFWQKNKNPFFANGVAKVLNKRPELAAQHLLQSLRIEANTTALSAMLYRLELGKLHIDSNGLKYLERLYDIGEYNSEGNYARRLDINGTLGVLDTQGEIKRVALLKHRPETDTPELAMVDLSLTLLFDFDGTETDGEISLRTHILDQFRSQYEELFAQKYRSIGLNNMPLKVQAWLLKFEHQSGKSLEQYLDTYGESGAVVLKLINDVAGEKFVNKMLEFPEFVGSVIIQKTYNVLAGLEALPLLTSETRNSIKREYLNRISAALETPDAEVGIRRLGDVRESIEVMAGVFSEIHTKKIELSDAAGASLEIFNQDKGFSVGDIVTMRSIYAENQKGRAAQGDLLSAFETRIQNPRAKIYALRWNGIIESFVAFEEKEDGSLYASSFNVSSQAKGRKVGEIMLEEAISREANQHVLKGDCYADLPISAKYIRTGWVATSAWDDHGDKVLDIIRDDRVRDQYWGKTTTREAIIAGPAPEGVTIAQADSQAELPFDLCTQGKVLTQLFFDPTTRQHYAVFESAPPTGKE